MATGRTRTDDQCLRDRAEIAHRYLRGELQVSIAVDLGLSESQISYDMGVIRKAWVQSFVRDYNEHVGELLARLDGIEAQAWVAWLRSLEPSERSVMLSTPNDDGDPVPVSHRLEKLHGKGDPVWLEIMLQCAQKRMEIFQLTTPDTVANTVVQNYVGKTTEERWSPVADKLGGFLVNQLKQARETGELPRENPGEQDDDAVFSTDRKRPRRDIIDLESELPFDETREDPAHTGAAPHVIGGDDG